MKYSITRLLVKKRALETQIEKGINLDTLLYSATEANFKADLEKAALQNQRSELDKYNKLLKQRAEVSNAITLSNAATKVTVAGTVMTVAEAIDRKNNMDAHKALVATMINTRTRVASVETRNEAEISSMISQRIAQVSGREADISKEVIQTIEDSVRKQLKLKIALIGSFDKEITKLRESIDNFLEEVDVCLNEANATTFVELEL